MSFIVKKLNLIFAFTIIMAGLYLCFENEALATIHIDPTLTDPTLPSQLGWVESYDPSRVCSGYYIQPKLSAFSQPVLPMAQAITSVTADSTSITNQNLSVLTGHVVVVQSGRRLYADKAVIVRDPKTGKIATIDLYGHIKILTNGRLLIANVAHLRVSDESGYLQNVSYRTILRSDAQLAAYLKPLDSETYALEGLTAWGQASSVRIEDKAHTFLYNPTYTTCAPNSNEWKLVAGKIRLNRVTQVGTAKDVTLKVANIPVFYWPYLNFPISNQRKSGFLFPIVGYTNVSGFEFAWPYYFNLAPNYDATFSPTVYSFRGVLFKGNFRYLTSNSRGILNVGVIPADQQFKKFQESAQVDYAGLPSLNSLEDASDTRGYFNWQNNSQFNPHLSAHVDFSQVSDDYYFNDFGAVQELYSINQLLRQADIDYVSDHWNLTGYLQDYYTLHQVNRQAVSNLYGRLPEFDFNSDYPNIFNFLDFYSNNQIVYFNERTNPGALSSPTNGGRMILDPGISVPRYWASGFFIPSTDFQMTNYALQNQIPGQNSEIVRTIPTVDVNSGLYFDRDLSLRGNDFTQTLEPQIFYLYVPYRNQNNIPEFDAGIIPFTYDQLFRKNRFSGEDRIGDANQISVALTTRFINEETGQEKIKFSIGEIYYFENRRVTLCSTPGCSDYDAGFMGATPENESLSPIAGQFNYFFNPAWSLNGDIAWDPTVVQTNNADIYFQYHPTSRFLINFGYNFLLRGDLIAGQPVTDSTNNLNQTTFSFAAPITRQWSGVGVLDYNISQNHPQTYLLGVQYDTCCWAARVAGGRTFSVIDQTGRAQFSTGVYVQFELKGLANLDPENLSTLLSGQIPGYQDPFKKTQTFI